MIKKYGIWVLFCSVMTVQFAYIALPYSTTVDPMTAQPVNWLVFSTLLTISGIFAMITFALRYFFLVRKSKHARISQFRTVCTLAACWALSVLIAANGITAFFIWQVPVLMTPFSLMGLYLMWFHSPNRVPQHLEAIKVKK